MEHPQAGRLISVLISAAGREGVFPLPDQVSRLQRFLPWVAKPREGSSNRVSKIPVRRLGRRLYPARPDEPSAWISLEAALAEVGAGHADGTGMCLPDGLCVVDIDHVLHDGVLNAETRQLVDRSRTWTEVSPSGTGLHLWFTAVTPVRSGRAGDLELLAANRFITVSGRDLPGTVRTIAQLPSDLSALFRSEERPAPKLWDAYIEKSIGDCDTPFTAALHRSSTLRRLYLDGDINAYSSGSEADLALCQLLHRWVGPDPVRIDALFQGSALYRSKWQGDYRDRTIALALRSGRWRE